MRVDLARPPGQGVLGSCLASQLLNVFSESRLVINIEVLRDIG